MIRDRVLAGLDRARSSGKRLGRPRTTPFQVQRIRLALDEGRGMRETARLLKVSAAKVSEVRRMAATSAGLRSPSSTDFNPPPTWLMVADVGYLLNPCVTKTPIKR